MRIRLLTLKFDELTGKIDDTALQEFAGDKEILSVKDHFFIKDTIPYLTLLVTYNSNSYRPSEEGKSAKAKKEAWRKLIKDEDKPLFNTLREWRAERCKKEGIPPYIICTNQQLALMVKKRPQSLTKLGEIEGFGKSKLEKYGRDILDILTVKSSPK